MLHHVNYYTHPGSFVAIIALSLCLLGGCWQEVRYAGLDDAAKGDSSKQGTIAPSKFTSDASGFGDELAAALASQPMPLTPIDNSPEPVSPLPVDDPLDAIGERYRTPPPGPSDAELDEALFGFLGPTQDNSAAPGAEAASPAEPIMDAVDPIATTPSAADTTKTRRAAWQLGNQWSLAALARERGAAADDVNTWFTRSQELAQSLGTTLNALPPSAGGDRDAATRAMVRHLLVEGQRLGRDLADRHGGDHAALFELGVKSNLLLVLYEPNTPIAETLAASIAQARELAQSPAELWQPLLTAIAEGREPAAIRQIVLRLPDEVDRSFAAAVER
jgi:hypothetical protein